jgi:hypothetical protein
MRQAKLTDLNSDPRLIKAAVSDNGEKVAPIIPVLLEFSNATRWEDAKFEWHLVDIRFVDREYAETCACGHYPICEVCKIKNEVTQIVIEVGNCCINQVSPEFDDLRRIFPARRDGRINPAIFDYAKKRNIINDWESRFLTDKWNRRRLSTKQSNKFKDIRFKLYSRINISAAQRKKIYERWYGTKSRRTNRAHPATEATAQ